MQAFKRVLDLTLSKRGGAEGARQFNSFNDFLILTIYYSYSYGFKNVRKVIDMTLKSLFFAVKSENSLSDWRLCPPVIRLGCIGLFSTGPKLNNFWEKNFAVGSRSLPHSKILVELLLVAFTAADRFFKRFFEPRTKRVEKHCRPYASLFSDMNTKFLK